MRRSRHPGQAGLNLGHELVVDNFAGGGGASTGIERAFGRPVDVAINHDPEAVAMHQANHPTTTHYCESVFKVDPVTITKNQPVGLAWFSPDCTHHSKAKGGKPRSAKRRGLAWVVIRWARRVRPRMIMLENVEEFEDWGPLTRDGKPCPLRKGQTFQQFVQQLQRFGYRVEWRLLRACDYGAPTIRRRLFLVARRDGLPIVWPEPTHGPGRAQPYRTAADCIDWSIPCPSIFERSRPLAEATLRRIARGIRRYVIEASEPFIVPVTHQGDSRVWSVSEPLRTVTTASRGEMALVTPFVVKPNHTGEGYECFRGQGLVEPLQTVTQSPGFGVVAPTLIQAGYGEREGQAPRSLDLEQPLGTVVAGGVKHALVGAFLAKHFTGVTGSDLRDPVATVTAVDHHSLVTAHLTRQFGRSTGSSPADPVGTVTAGGGGKTHLTTTHLIKLRGSCRDGQPVTQPLPTVCAGGWHVGEVRAFLVKYYGQGTGSDLSAPSATVTSKDRMGLVTVQGQQYQIADIGMRMLQPRELFRAQGFPDSYQIAPVANGRPLSKTAQVRMAGNSVCPDVAAALVRVNFAHEAAYREDYANVG